MKEGEGQNCLVLTISHIRNLSILCPKFIYDRWMEIWRCLVTGIVGSSSSGQGIGQMSKQTIIIIIIFF